jgi:hypothetical protein
MGDAALIKKLGIKPGQRAAVINRPMAMRIGSAHRRASR